MIDFFQDDQGHRIRRGNYPLKAVETCQHVLIVDEGKSLVGLEMWCAYCGLCLTITNDELDAAFRKKARGEGES